MNNTRIFNPVVLLSLAAGVILLLAFGFIAWLNLSEASISFGGLTLPQVSRPEPVMLRSSGVTAEGLAIYRQSERDLASPSANVEGMTLYHMSEWGTNAAARIKAAGLDIYRQSERSSAVPVSIEQGLAIYLRSEHNSTPVEPGFTVEGMDIYHASERDR